MNQYNKELSVLQLRTIFEALVSLNIDDVIVNSVESRFTLSILKESGFNNITLLAHEMADYYKEGEWSEIDNCANRIHHAVVTECSCS